MSTSAYNSTQLGTRTYIMDGGLETTLIFEHGYDLPEFAAFPLLDQKKGCDILRNYYLRYIRVAKENNYGFILEGPTYRASSSWGKKLGYDDTELKRINTEAIALLTDLKGCYADEHTPMLVSGCIGPEGDGYHIDHKLTVEEAETYHRQQIRNFKEAGADLVSAYTINYVEEAIGIVRASQKEAIPAVISFTVETDGRLPSGQPLGEAISRVDAETDQGPAYFMVNCAHPSHFRDILNNDQDWLGRIRAVRANASKKSHAELEECEELDRGNLSEFGQENAALTQFLPNLHIFGGCCGTDHHHIEEICHHIGA